MKHLTDFRKTVETGVNPPLTLVTTNFHLYLIQLWWQIFQMFVCGDVVYAQTWQVLNLKNCMEPFS